MPQSFSEKAEQLLMCYTVLYGVLGIIVVCLPVICNGCIMAKRCKIRPR